MWCFLIQFIKTSGEKWLIQPFYGLTVGIFRVSLDLISTKSNLPANGAV